MKKCLLCLMLILAALLFATACGNSPAEPPPSESEQDGEQQLPVGDGEKIQLTISNVFVAPPFKAAIERFEALHPEVEVVLHEYDDFDKYHAQLTTQLMAGNADDLFNGSTLADLKLHESGYLADIYLLMQNDPDFHEEDYFMNVFKASAHQGKLMLFTTVFAYHLFGVNNCVSADVAEHFQQYDTVTNRQILELYQGFAPESDMYAYGGLNAFYFLIRNLQDYIDYENKTCNFNSPEFIELLRDLKEATSPQRTADGMMGGISSYGEDGFLTPALEEEALQYLFKWTNSGRVHYAALFPFAEPQAFADFKPLVSETGNLLIEPFYLYGISEASQNKEWAWEFLKFLTTPAANEGWVIFGTPVHRGLFQSYMPADLAEAAEYWRKLKAIEGDNETVAARQMAIYEQYLDMPMEQIYKFTSSIGDIIQPVITNFYNGSMTAEQVASELQNKVSLYLME